MYQASGGYAGTMNCGWMYALAAWGRGAGGGTHMYTGGAYEPGSRKGTVRSYCTPVSEPDRLMYGSPEWVDTIMFAMG